MKIGIFTAMKKEAVSFLKKDTPKVQVGAFDVYALKLGKHDAYLCCPPSVGEIAAAAACQLLISQFDANIILNFGVVGALNENTTLLSTVYVGSVVHYDMDLSSIDYLPVGRYSCFPDTAVPCDKSLLDKALSVVELPMVRCASADKFVDAKDSKAALNAKFGAEICDMESAGILFACKFNKIPCLLVKCISDSLCGGYAEYNENAENAARGFFQFAEKLASVLD
ncbi:MAG: 5'-methylthioadenosine/S-adenosylhomocysteine nucleosidase [Corallococcus sp.]|nr:5'-methylthioadenosine/S-adenosylhomocysteine nucleosidase [Corallococcus sp.]MCM1359496.1 5'-methylthioadenosine/S-adenosylhomocysteine nucleosidase [Corallococcus sp.]MCM1394692.1 5'-methylthioadenosine/S-adenosylhomocysteine nucleosidase [Corallococcus sp.]